MKTTTTKILLVIAVAFFSMALLGKPVKRNAARKITSKEVLSKIDITAKSLHSFQAQFLQTEIDPVFDEIYESTGKFYFNKATSVDDNKTPVFQLRFDYLKPDQTTTIINGGSVIIYTPEMSEPQESYLIDDIKMDAFFAPFVSSERLRENYDAIVLEETSKKVTVLFSPKTDIVRKHFRELRVTFSKSNWLPLSIYQLKRSGQKITFKFAKIVLNRTISQDMFTLSGLKKSLTGYSSHRRAKKSAKRKKGRDK